MVGKSIHFWESIIHFPIQTKITRILKKKKNPPTHQSTLSIDTTTTCDGLMNEYN